MNRHTLEEAKHFEEITPEVSADLRPVFHLSSRFGWMNDPNGFSYYNGQYHLFYQYYPYENRWGPMHWGHAVTKDFIKWEYLPVVLAPENDYDWDGCFSGSAIELEDGRHLLMYTAVKGGGESIEQTQCLALGHGRDYVKYEGNPILSQLDLPEGLSRKDFRDPKMGREADGTLYCVAGACTEDKDAKILYFRSPNGIDWKFAGILEENDHRIGKFWECPDFFELDGKYVLLCSPMEVLKTSRYHNGNVTLCEIGTFDHDAARFTPEYDQPTDYGIDFYATQTVETPDGRRIMIAWMRNWDVIGNDDLLPWVGSMSIPRELSVKDGKLLQKPVRELEACRSERVVYKNQLIQGRTELEGIRGRAVDLLITLHPGIPDSYQSFEIRFAENERFHTSLTWHPDTQELVFDRSFSGCAKAIVHKRTIHIENPMDTLQLRLLIDRFSMECFVNDGSQVITCTMFTELSADGISFSSDGETIVDIEKYTISLSDQ